MTPEETGGYEPIIACAGCGVIFEDILNWICPECDISRPNVPTLEDYDLHDYFAFTAKWALEDEEALCCGKDRNLCNCNVSITLELANEKIGDTAYDVFASCHQCFHYCRFSCSAYKEYVMEEIEDNLPEPITSCGDFIWDDSTEDEDIQQ